MRLDSLEPELIHRLKNHLAVAVGFVHLLIDDADASDPRLDDLTEIRLALDAAVQMMPELSQQLTQRTPPHMS